ncbi:MAG: lysophospholipid acyltransferase family protein [Desulfocapsa sp.]|nr:lysophospholipid acyltransferase family protein [Desulfocapsa sp.]
MKGNFWYRVSLRVLPSVFTWLTRIWFSTCRIKTHGQRYRDQVDNRKIPIIASFWHYTILFIFYYLRKDSAVVMVSASKDGEYISRVAKKFGHETVRGSRKKRGFQAIKGLIRHMREGRNAGIVADGSQGPALVVQAGSIVLASHAGAPILPMVWSCNRYKRFGSWDGTVVPYPFSRIDFFYGEPLDVPSKIKSEEVEKYRLILENRLNNLYDEAWALHGKTEH